MKCKNCDRELPNESFITENGCLWCDCKKHDLSWKLKKKKK
jgi:hypothetical protein